MARLRRISKAVHAIVLLSLLFAVTGDVTAERLPIKTYTTADGLARDTITRIVSDSRGFLWFCTNEGLSRFDGYKFINYGIDQGLPHREVTALLETRSGVYWVVTPAGLCRFNPDPPLLAGNPRQRFVVYRSGDEAADRYVSAICEDSGGTIWCGTHKGLYRLDQVNGEWIFSFADILRSAEGAGVNALMEDRRGSLWITTPLGLYRRRPDGIVEVYTAREGLPVNQRTSALVEDRDGQIWVGTTSGLYRLVRDPEPGQPVVARLYTKKDGLASNSIVSLFHSSNGKLWVGTGVGLSEFLPEANKGGGTFQNYTKDNGLSDLGVTTLAEDRDGNLWIGTESGGAMKLAANGFTTYREVDGLGGIRISQISEDRAGKLCIISGEGHINRFDGARFTPVPLPLPKGIPYWGWGWYQVMFQDSAGEWWMSTGKGLVRYPKLSRLEQLPHARPKAIYTTRDGLAGDEVFRIFEDSRGDLWIGTLDQSEAALTRWERANETFRRYSPADGVPPFGPTAFCEDASGNIWIGLYGGGLLRYSVGRFRLFTQADGVPSGFVRGLYVDHADRLWVATAEGGVARLDDPGADHPHFTTYTTADGLSSNQATCVTGDQWGRIYIGTGRGVNRLDPATGRIRHYTTADGLANNYINVSFRDREGALWFGTLQGVSRLIPESERPTLPPSILISGLNIGGEPHPVPELGGAEIVGPEVSASRNQIDINFVGISLGAGETLRYQIRLEGADRDWSAPTDQRAVSYPNLAPGGYRFLVRAVSADGTLSPTPASVQFKILPPVWRRWWFLTIGAMMIGAAVFAFARSRYERMKALRESENRFRTLAETASDAILTIDEQSRIVYVNESAEKIFGYTQQEMIGADLTMLMPEYLRHRHREGFSHYKETGKRHISWHAIELPGLHKSGAQIPLELSFGEFTKDDKRFFTGIARDITERKRAEEERNQTEEALRRSREERFAELERVRQRIATDLHDDIGSSLTRISLLSEVVQRQIDSTDAPVVQPLSSIARLSRELVDSMSDIVWAINPKKDQLSDLSQRMRHFASDVFTARGIDFRFRAPDAAQNIKVGANSRRELFLLFKEAVNNTVRHSGCSHADIEFRAEANGLFLKLSDNGRGFDVSRKSGGHGLASMRERTEGLGGKLGISSREGEGTALTFTIPFSHQDQTSSGSVAAKN